MQTIEAIKWALLGGACSEALITLEQIARVSEKKLVWPYKKEEIPVLCTAAGFRLFLGGTLAAVVVTEHQFSISAKIAAFTLGVTAPLAFSRIVRILRFFGTRGGAGGGGLLLPLITQLLVERNGLPQHPSNALNSVPGQPTSPENTQSNGQNATGEDSNGEQ